MNTTIEKTLIEQLELLAERSKNARIELLPELTVQMINLALILDPELRNQFWRGILAHSPYVSLSMTDLTDITNAREERSRRLNEHLKKVGIEVHE